MWFLWGKFPCGIQFIFTLYELTSLELLVSSPRDLLQWQGVSELVICPKVLYRTERSTKFIALPKWTQTHNFKKHIKNETKKRAKMKQTKSNEEMRKTQRRKKEEVNKWGWRDNYTQQEISNAIHVSRRTNWRLIKQTWSKSPFVLTRPATSDSTTCASVIWNTCLCTESELDTYPHHFQG